MGKEKVVGVLVLSEDSSILVDFWLVLVEVDLTVVDLAQVCLTLVDSNGEIGSEKFEKSSKIADF